jgi:hypothetical protein
MAGFVRDVRDHEANQDRSPVEHLLIEELASSVVECADRRRVEHAGRGVREREAPLPRHRVVEPEVEPAKTSLRAVHLELDEIRAAAPDRMHRRHAFVRDPARRARQRIGERLHRCLPAADLEIEIVRAVVHADRGARWT